MSIEAMKQALEALENTLGFTGSRQIDSATRQAITSLRQAIAEAEKQEPVAWIEHHKGGDNLVWDEPNKGTPLYTHPQPKREPLLVFAKECVLGAYRESELADAAQRAIEAAHGIKEKNNG